MDEELDKQSFISLMEILNTSLGNRIPNKLATRLLAWRNTYTKHARIDEIEALVTHIQDKFEEVEVLLNEYQYVRTRAIDAEDALTEGGDHGGLETPGEPAK